MHRRSFDSRTGKPLFVEKRMVPPRRAFERMAGAGKVACGERFPYRKSTVPDRPDRQKKSYQRHFRYREHAEHLAKDHARDQACRHARHYQHDAAHFAFVGAAVFAVKPAIEITQQACRVGFQA